jgi:hypothetical protein
VETDRGGMAKVQDRLYLVVCLFVFSSFLLLFFPTLICYCKTDGVLSPEWVLLQHPGEGGCCLESASALILISATLLVPSMYVLYFIST